MLKKTSHRAGRTRTQPTGYSAFIPEKLPPAPPLIVDLTMQQLLQNASLELGRLDGLASILPNPDGFVTAFVRKEALLSSQIEGTQASLDEVLAFEAAERTRTSHERTGAPEVYRYVKAMKYGLGRLNELPLSLRLIKEIHGVLLDTGRGSDKSPGEFRKSQNWIGSPGCTLKEATFVPPPPLEMNAALSELEKYLHKDNGLPLLVQIALVHAQFETIHPFLDGNGRVGRLLITLLLCHAKVLRRPLLYLSYFFKQRRSEYYERLDAVRFAGAWEGWVMFFLQGIVEVARQAVQAATQIIELRERHFALIHRKLPRASTKAIQLLDYCFQHPYLTATDVTTLLRVSGPTARSQIAKLASLGVLEEITRRNWGRVFAYREYIDILREGTELPSENRPTQKAATARKQVTNPASK
ncbi:MAG TPA: Fic family protein [Pirellulaceae bacterium]|nr:Fic family protein [Pirellulaceae bacterium]